MSRPTPSDAVFPSPPSPTHSEGGSLSAEEPLPAAAAAPQSEANSAKSFFNTATQASSSSAQNQPSDSSSRDNTNKPSNSSPSTPIETGPTAKLTVCPSSIPPSAPPTSSATSSLSFMHQNGNPGDLENSGALSGLPSTAVVAPAVTGATSIQSFSLNSQLQVTGDILPNSSHSPLQHVHEKESPAALLNSPSPTSSVSGLIQNFNNLVTAAKQAQPSAASAARINMSVHCLVIDNDHEDLKQDGAKELLAKALELAHNKQAAALQSHVANWLSPSQVEVQTVYAIATHGNPLRIHINFASHDVLANAMMKFPFLSRCLPGRSWGTGARPTACNGGTKHSLPELLRITFEVKEEVGASKTIMAADVKHLLTDVMKLNYSTFWTPIVKDSNQSGGHRTQAIFVLPRIVDLPSLRREVDRLHMSCEFRGSKIRVSGAGPGNSKLLSRCTLCDQLGHPQEQCGIYSGCAVRFIGNKPFPYQAMLDLQLMTKAKTAFLGKGIDVRQPSRRLTLLLDVDTWSDESQSVLLQLICDMQHQKILFEDPKLVDIKTRFKECNECGSIKTPHECPFALGRVVKPKPAAVKPKPSENKVGEASSALADKMCRAWRRWKLCSRMATCKFEHPEAHVAEQICFEFRDSGACMKDGCIFRHVQPEKPVEVEKQKSNVLSPLQQPAAAAPKAALASKKRGHESPSKESPSDSVPAVRRQGVNPFSSLSSDTVEVDEDEEKGGSVTAPSSPSRNNSQSRAPSASPTKKQKQSGAEETQLARPPVSSLSSMSSPSPSRPQPLTPNRSQSVKSTSGRGGGRGGTKQ